MTAFDTDVFVLGGGPAGLAAAIAARSSGLRVVLADASQPPIDKPCGEGLMPDSLAVLAGLGVAVPIEQSFPFRGIRFAGPNHSVAAEFPAGVGVGIRRPLLHRLLADRAQATGVDFCWNQTINSIDRHRITLPGQHLTARWIIGADGTQSRLRSWAGIARFGREAKRYSYRRHFPIAPWSDYMEIHWGRGCQFYVTPVSSQEICLVLMTRNPKQRIADALPDFPHLAHRLAGVNPSTAERGALAATRSLRRVTAGHIALIGDASGTVDPITGEGLCLAFQQASALAKALAVGNLGLYQRAHTRLARRPRFMADFMLLLDRSSLLRTRTLVALSRKPELFKSLLAMHVGKASPLEFASTAAALSLQLLTA